MRVLPKTAQQLNRPVDIVRFAATIWLLSAFLATAQAAQAEQLNAVNEQGLLQFDQTGMVQLADVVLLNPQAIRRIVERDMQAPFTLEPVYTDRYGQMHAYVIDAAGRVLQALLVQRGLARAMAVQPGPRMRELIAFDTTPPITAEDTPAHLDTYAVVRGVVRDVAIRRGKAYVNFGEDWKQDFTIYIPSPTLKRMNRESLLGLIGKEVVVRGYLYRYNGPCITLFDPILMSSHAF